MADGLTLWHGAQLATDTNGTARRRAAKHDGAALEDARQWKERTYLELSGDGGRARLVVPAAEVGGRWSAETAEFLCALAKARAQSEPLLRQCRGQAAWLRRWSAILAEHEVLHIVSVGSPPSVRDDRFSELALRGLTRPWVCDAFPGAGMRVSFFFSGRFQQSLSCFYKK